MHVVFFQAAANLRGALPMRMAALKTQARPDRNGPSGPREIDAGWMGAHAPITNLDSCGEADRLKGVTSNWRPRINDLKFTIPDGRSGRTYLGRGTHPAGSSRARNLVGKIKKVLSR